MGSRATPAKPTSVLAIRAGVISSEVLTKPIFNFSDRVCKGTPLVVGRFKPPAGVIPLSAELVPQIGNLAVLEIEQETGQACEAGEEEKRHHGYSSRAAQRFDLHKRPTKFSVPG